MKFRILWSTPSGKFGWSDVSKCSSFEGAADHWFTLKRKGTLTVPGDADIDCVKRITATR